MLIFKWRFEATVGAYGPQLEISQLFSLQVESGSNLAFGVQAATDAEVGQIADHLAAFQSAATALFQSLQCGHGNGPLFVGL